MVRRVEDLDHLAVGEERVGYEDRTDLPIAEGFRQGRIKERIETNDGPIDAEDMASIQGEWRSPLGARMAFAAAPTERRFVFLIQRGAADVVLIESNEPIHMNLDGEPILETTFDFSVLPQQLPAVLPEAAPMV